MKETILLFNITDRNTKLKLERILLPLKLRIRRIPVSQYGQTLADRKSTRLNSSHIEESRMPSSA